MGLLIILGSIVSIYRLKMIGLCILALFPAFVLSKSVVSGDITEIQVCQYFDARIQRFEVKVKEMKALVDVDSEFYRTLEASKLCDTVGRVAVPECVANHEGDDCAAAKIESIKKPFLRAIKVDKSGKEFFDYCKYIGYKNVLNTFLQTRKLMSGECGLPGQKLIGDREPRNSLLLPLLIAGAYDPSSIWFQYFLCKDQQIYCYFFTQGWNQHEYGQYYLYENLLDDQNGIFLGATGSNDLATIALLGGLGGGAYQGGYYPPPNGYSQVPASQGRKRREIDEESCDPEVEDCSNRKRRRSDNCDTKVDGDCSNRKRRSSDECNPKVDGDCSNRKRRSSDDCDPIVSVCSNRKRRSSEKCNPKVDGDCSNRKRRSSDKCDPNVEDCRNRSNRKRRSSDNCDPNVDEDCSNRKSRSSDKCDPNVDEDCSNRKRRSSDNCDPSVSDCSNRNRRHVSNCPDPENEFCCVEGKWECL